MRPGAPDAPAEPHDSPGDQNGLSDRQNREAGVRALPRLGVDDGPRRGPVQQPGRDGAAERPGISSATDFQGLPAGAYRACFVWGAEFRIKKFSWQDEVLAQPESSQGRDSR